MFWSPLTYLYTKIWLFLFFCRVKNSLRDPHFPYSQLKSLCLLRNLSICIFFHGPSSLVPFLMYVQSTYLYCLNSKRIELILPTFRANSNVIQFIFEIIEISICKYVFKSIMIPKLLIYPIIHKLLASFNVFIKNVSTCLKLRETTQAIIQFFVNRNL